jgi:hypothetical protein
VSKTFGEWYQKTNKTEDTNKLTLLAFKIIAILHNTLLTTFIQLLETVSKGLIRNRSQNLCHTFPEAFLNVAISVLLNSHCFLGSKAKWWVILHSLNCASWYIYVRMSNKVHTFSHQLIPIKLSSNYSWETNKHISLICSYMFRHQLCHPQGAYMYLLSYLYLQRSPRTTSLDTTRPSTIFYRLLLNRASLRS